MNSSLEGTKYQVAESVEADFEKNTWTFRLPGWYVVGAGNYAILPVDEFAKMNAKLAHAKGLLRSLRNITSLCALDKENIDRFFDPEPLG